MDFKEFDNFLIYHILRGDYHNSGYHPYWFKYVEYMDLGVNCVRMYVNRFYITDEKKWALSKIKYGF